LKEKKEVVEEAENGRDAPANGNAVSVQVAGACVPSLYFFKFSA
jgi:hypothetical protein